MYLSISISICAHHTATIEFCSRCRGTRLRTVLKGPQQVRNLRCLQDFYDRFAPDRSLVPRQRLEVKAINGPAPFVIVAHVVAGGGLDIGVMGQFLGDRQIMFFDHPGNE
ncbi:hypothetical protein AYJ70_27455 [Pseudomonas monteilii]|uniref:Uncharacterized protein n=1 Tax=Pseudomonas monteilii TaxID=76759 RepID=A0AAP7FNP6_9PSED|nr:hypothetical protein AYJ70_27455 [Pseudomonas monteilii]